MRKGSVISLKALDAHRTAFQWLDARMPSSYAYFSRLLMDALFCSNEQRPTADDLSRALVNFLELSRLELARKDQSLKVEQIPDVVLEHIDQAARTAMDAVHVTKTLMEAEFGQVPNVTHYELQPSSGYDLIFSYEVDDGR